MCEKHRAREASVTDSAEAAVKGSSNTAGGEGIGAKKPEGYTLLEERVRGKEEGDRDPELKKWRGGGETVFPGFFFTSPPSPLLFETRQVFPFYSSFSLFASSPFLPLNPPPLPFLLISLAFCFFCCSLHTH